MSGGKGGSSSSSVEIPEWVEEPSKRNLERAERASQIGYQPYYGPDVAAFTPTQESVFQANNQAAQAFGIVPQGQGYQSGVPTPQTFDNGMQGYSSGSLYDMAMAELAKRNPGQYNAYNDLFIDPQTGAPAEVGSVESNVQSTEESNGEFFNGRFMTGGRY